MTVSILILDCESVVNDTLKSPHYPDDYPSDVYCSYNIPIPNNSALIITFEYFYLEKVDGLLCTWVKLLRGCPRKNG